VSTPRLTVLLVDGKASSLAELGWVLDRHASIAVATRKKSAAEALLALRRQPVDAVFVDIDTPGVAGLQLARSLSRWKDPPSIVLVAADADHAVEAFDLNAVDYLLKPVRGERLSQAVRRIVARRRATD